MSKYAEIKAQQGYTDADFGSQRLYLTQRAAETALAAGIVQIRPLRPEIELVREFVDSNTSDKYKFPAELDELQVVMRWGDRSEWRPWKWDTKLRKAKPETRFLHAGSLFADSVEELRRGHAPADSKTLGEMDPLKTVEVTVFDWDNPNLATDFARGVLFNFYAQRQGYNPLTYAARDLFEAFDPTSLQRTDLAQRAGNLTRPLDELLPIAPLRPSDITPPSA